MTSRLKARLQRLENRTIPKPGDKLPLALIRRCLDEDPLPPDALKPWSTVIAEILASADTVPDHDEWPE